MGFNSSGKAVVWLCLCLVACHGVPFDSRINTQPSGRLHHLKNLLTRLTYKAKLQQISSDFENKFQETGSDDALFSSGAHDRFDDVIPPEVKRQQGWHVKYGKRDGDVIPSGVKRQQGWYGHFGKRSDYDDVIPSGVKRQQGWHVKYGKRDIFGGAIPSRVKRQQGWYGGYGKRDLDNYNMFNDVDQDRFRDVAPADKRNQGWYTTYGKRQQGWPTFGEHFDNTVFHDVKRKQGWHSTYGKRDDYNIIPSIAKRQQGWHISYGKRQNIALETVPDTFSDDIVVNKYKRQQGWHSGFGKRQDYDVLSAAEKRQQGWHITYGKRDDSDITPTSEKRQQGWHTAYGKRQDSTGENLDSNKMYFVMRGVNSRDDSHNKRLIMELLLAMNRLQPEIKSGTSQQKVGFVPLGSEATFRENNKDVIDDGNINDYFDGSESVDNDGSFNDNALDDDSDNTHLDEDDEFASQEKRQQGWHSHFGKRSMNI